MGQISVGIIANPASGKDIRRLVAHGSVFDNQEKVNIISCLLLAFYHTGVDKVIYMPDYNDLVGKAMRRLGSSKPKNLEVIALEMTMTAGQEDSRLAARLMSDMKLGAIVTLGGDGTNRQVAMGCGDIPLVPISTGTNNVFPSMVDATNAGLAAGVAASWALSEQVGYRAKKLEIIKNGKIVDEALIDAVVLKDSFIGARATWKTENITEAFFTQGEAHSIGLASILGKYSPLSPRDKKGAWLKINPKGQDVFAPIAPGLFLPIGISEMEEIALGEERNISTYPSIIALDGEKEVMLSKGDNASVKLQEKGPFVVDIKGTLREAVSRGFFKVGNYKCRDMG